MKRFYSLLLLMLMLAPASYAKVKFGVEAGAYINKLKFNKDIVSSENRAGFFIGPKLKASLALGFGVDAALLYSNRSAEFNIASSENTKNLNFITVPVNVRWQLGSDRFAPYVATGPQWDFFIGNANFSTDALKATFEHNIISWNIGVGLMLLEHVQIGFSWNFPITNSGKIDKYAFDEVKQEFTNVIEDSSKLKNKEWTIRVNYYF